MYNRNCMVTNEEQKGFKDIYVYLKVTNTEKKQIEKEQHQYKIGK